jgi:hypothetical protein
MGQSVGRVCRHHLQVTESHSAESCENIDEFWCPVASTNSGHIDVNDLMKKLDLAVYSNVKQLI